jgi:hypothetical protein
MRSRFVARAAGDDAMNQGLRSLVSSLWFTRST